MSSVTLTIAELIEICEYMGYPETCFDHWLEYMDSADELESEVTIHQSHKGIAVFDEESGKEGRYRIAVTCDGCGLNEVQPIGEPL